MKKYHFILPLIIFPLLILLFTGCPNGGPEDLPERPTIIFSTADSISNGADLKLEWIDNTDGGSEIFYIYAGNTAIDSTFNLSYTIDKDDRSSSVGVTAWIGDEESPEATHDLSLTVTTALDVWSTADPSPDHPSFVKFTNGNASTVSADHADEATFYINDDIQFESIKDWVPAANVDPGFTSATSPYNFAPAPGNYITIYPTSGSMIQGATYYIWIDRAPIYDPPAWGIEDYFAKIEVTSIAGYKVTLKISYQNENGLRWLVD